MPWKICHQVATIILISLISFAFPWVLVSISHLALFITLSLCDKPCSLKAKTEFSEMKAWHLARVSLCYCILNNYDKQDEIYLIETW